MEAHILNIVLFIAIIAPIVAVLAVIIQAIVKPYRRTDDDWSKLHEYTAGNSDLQYEGMNINISQRVLRGSGYGQGENERILNFTVEVALTLGAGAKVNIYKKSFTTFLFIKEFFSKVIKTGNPDFDSRYSIESEDERFVRGVLTGEIQNKLLELAKDFVPRLYGADGIVSFAVLKKKPQNKEQYDRIVSTALMIFSQMKRIYPDQISGNISVEQVDQKNQIKVVVDFIKTGFKVVLIILIGLIVLCYFVMKLLA